ncbi:uncharacterized protein MYCFIDRAFT_78995 [Pseudocercospora fijiensis CIRAD86]|uniref:Uncharacterized protein n=1 Tax=Pseudocercospora fijiensis (strain CIRAD86) TaxID=383855 RepID=M3ADC7_PSEFD|nr:uncharacterized protein MYCFIDRAFT_78995 [Pseudocercospora fijiensis CIRAD86]EME82551.1 hypothetical protein MYCFIDRAFT_78995 [Pseudocercospora fijiensis CIRAD86]
MLRSLYLLWLPIAFLALSVHSNENTHLLNARNALASEISDVQTEFGESNVDTSLEGYDHELLLTRDTDTIPKKAARILKPHHKVIRNDDEEDEDGYEVIAKRELIEHQKRALEAKFGDAVDFSLEGYDENLLNGEDEEGEGIVIEKRGEEGEEIDWSLEGYDEELLKRDVEDEDGNGEGEEEIDWSLEGYDEELLHHKRGEDDDDEDYNIPSGDGTPYDADFESSPDFLKAWDSDSGIFERDFEDEEDGVEDGEEEEGIEVLTGAVRRDVSGEEEEEEGDWIEVVKRWVGWE